MPSSQEQAWAEDLAAARQKTAMKHAIPLAIQKKQLAEDMVYYTDAFRQSIAEDDTARAEQYFDKLIRAHAKQTAIALEEKRKKYGGVRDEELAQELEHVRSDLLNLLNA